MYNLLFVHVVCYLHKRGHYSTKDRRICEIVALLVNILDCLPIVIHNGCSVGNLIFIFLEAIEMNNEKWRYIVHRGDLFKKK